MVSDGFKPNPTLTYLEHDLCKSNIPVDEFFSLYKKLSLIPELEDFELLNLHQRMSYDKLDYVSPTGNIHLAASYDSFFGGLEEMVHLIMERTGLSFDQPVHWTGQDNRGSFLYRFSDGENIARIVLTFYD